VQVAIKMIQRNEQVQAGQSIQYIVIEGNTSSIAERALTPKEFSSQKDAKIDYQWYLSTQVHPPVCRLCEVIEGTDAARIADCLGKQKQNKTHSSIHRHMHILPALALLPGCVR